MLSLRCCRPVSRIPVTSKIVRGTAWRSVSTVPSPPQSPLDILLTDKKIPKSPADPKVKVNKAMRAYLEKAQAHSMFMKQQKTEFEIGKRHLANMMGEDPETFTQDDIDRSIRYLLPSNLFHRKALPRMKPPEEIFPQQKEAQFDFDGRPFHPFFYTGLPNYYQILHDINEWTSQLNVLEDERVRIGRAPPDKKIDLTGSQWMDKDEIRALLLEKIHDPEYNKLILSLERLVQHPYVYRVESFIKRYRKALEEERIDMLVPELKKDEAGRSYAESHATRKTCHVWLTLKEGTGEVNINGQDILFFPRVQDRLQVLFPLQLLDRVSQFDITVKAEFSGYSSKSGAIREALSKCLTAFVGEEEREILRHAGLLTHDKRIKERHKVGYRGARAKPMWKKR